MEILSRLIPVGKIVRTHGVRGALKVHPFGETLVGAHAGLTCYTRRPGEHQQISLTVSKIRIQGRHLVLEFEEIAGMDAAREMVGCELSLPEELLPPVLEGEYYHYQLIGLSVVTVQGRRLGTIKGIIETAANDVYVTELEGREFLIPALEDVVLEVDLEAGEVRIDPPEGLLDDL